MQLKRRVALVTGGAVRVGRAIAEGLAGRGAHVAISYRTSRKQADEAVAAFRRRGVRAIAVRADLSKVDDAKRLVATVIKEFGRLDVLVNSASVFERLPIEKITEAAWDRHLETNLKGPAFLSLFAAREMKRHVGGKIINITDWAGERPYTDYLPYCISKAGLIALTKALAKELAPTIQVIAIAPGPILAPPDMTREERERVLKRVPLQRWGEPRDIANAVLFAVEGTDFMTGSTIYVDGGRMIA